ncbi:MAG: hypothetical protein ABH814_01140 [bacterium]
MIYLLYGNQKKPIDLFLESLPFKKTSFDNFKEMDGVVETLYKGDTLFGETNLWVLNNFPKDSLNLLTKIVEQKPAIELALCYLGDNLSLKKVGDWVNAQGGVVKDFSVYHSRAIFKLLDAVSQQNAKNAVAALRKMQTEGENLLLGLAFLFTRLEKIISGARKATLSPKKALSLQVGLLELEKKLKSLAQDPWESVESWLLINLL